MEPIIELKVVARVMIDWEAHNIPKPKKNAKESVLWAAEIEGFCVCFYERCIAILNSSSLSNFIADHHESASDDVDTGVPDIFGEERVCENIDLAHLTKRQWKWRREWMAIVVSMRIG